MKLKNILIATDFTDSALWAALYAAQLAHYAGGRIILLHVLPLLKAADAEDNALIDLEAGAQAKLDALAHGLHATYGVSVTRLLRPGFAADEIPALAKRVKAELVVLGSCRKPGAAFGYITAAILGSGNFGVLCVPPQAVFNPYAGITYLRDEPESALPQEHSLYFKIQEVYESAKVVALLTKAVVPENTLFADVAGTNETSIPVVEPVDALPAASLLVLLARDLQEDFSYFSEMGIKQASPLLLIPRQV
ncbi:universal stress protein [Pontibacter sp. 172403-2]|uniref:universal stress protein n=1 Tax=Pontibacter rufus TaxID=2791028 RepID=UPI0018AF8805|nr:universal stress protein [Pontibacter sp. 172403-2]MBF9254123.1 universal stress protein [Pontibacter sp. 172403-2]